MNKKVIRLQSIIRIIGILILLFVFIPTNGAWSASLEKTVRTEPVPTGTYDDTNTAVVYSSSWLHHPYPGSYNSTESYSRKIGSTANLTFSGTGVKIIFRTHPLFGVMNVSIDGRAATALNQYTPSQLLQREWNSPNLTNGTHTLTMTHARGTYVNLDAITVSGATAGGYTSIMYDDSDTINIRYSSSWIPRTFPGSYNTTESYSPKIGSTSKLTFSGTGVKIIFRTHPLFGVMNVSIDGRAAIAVNQYASSQQLQRKWSGPNLTQGRHTLTMSHTSGKYVVLDAIEVINPVTAPTPVPTIAPTQTPSVPPANTEGSYYDDINSVFTYIGDWKTYTHLVDGPYEGTGHYSLTTGNSATVNFTGSGVTLVYTGDSNRGIMDILVDGQVVANLDQRADGLQWQKEWWLNKQSWSSGEHTLVFRHASGEVVDIDAIKIGKHALCGSSSNSADREGIIRVQLNTGDKSSTRAPYTDNPEIFTTLNTGGTYTISITAEKVNSDPYAVYAKVWIDFNNDGNFEELTTNIDQGMMQFFNGTYIFSKEFTVPTGLNPCDVKMRIVLRANALPDSCGQYDYGETEDFNITLQ